MASTTSLRSQSGAATTPCGCRCGPGQTCDGLECLCRPRFFAGQLLTDDDLNRLDHYIVSKNRLHNKYLHGSGVVCGLEVVCNPCDDTVTVRSGYALGPCGEDIVVCHDAPVDVGAMIRDHRKQRAAANCLPYGARPTTDCDAARQRWILAICYDEQASRGVTSLRQPKATGNCGCGGGRTGSTSAGTSSDSCSCRSPRATPAQCEPTVTCEGYRFVLRKEPTVIRDVRGNALTAKLGTSELGRRVQACLLEITGQIQLMPSNPSAADLVAYCCVLKADLADIIETGNIHDCMLGARLSNIVCPDPDDQDAVAKAVQAIQVMLQIAIDLFKSCVCSALLPPCSVDTPDDCIPLATLTVRTSDLKVLDICNWSSRKFAVTMPALGYWLGWLPLFDSLRQAISKLCCTTRPAAQFRVDDKLRVLHAQPLVEAHAANFAAGAAAGAPAAAAAADTTSTVAPVTAMMSQYAHHLSPLAGLEATVLSALGGRDPDNAVLASDLEQDNAFAALALSRLAGPSLGAAVPAELTRVLGQIFARSGHDDTGVESHGPLVAEPVAEQPAADDRFAELEKALADLHKKVTAQARTITTMQKQIKPS